MNSAIAGGLRIGFPWAEFNLKDRRGVLRIDAVALQSCVHIEDLTIDERKLGGFLHR